MEKTRRKRAKKKSGVAGTSGVWGRFNGKAGGERRPATGDRSSTRRHFRLKARLRQNFDKPLFRLAEDDDSSENFVRTTVRKEKTARFDADLRVRREFRRARFSRFRRRNEENAVDGRQTRRIVE